MLKRAGRRKITERATVILTALRGERLDQPPAVTAAYAVTVRSLIAVITTLNHEVKTLQGQVEADFGQHPDAEIYQSQPGMGAVLGDRVFDVFGDDPTATPTAWPAEATRVPPADPRVRQEENRHRPVHPQ